MVYLNTALDHGTLELTKIVAYGNDSITYRAAGPTSGALYDVKCYTRWTSRLGIDSYSLASAGVSAVRSVATESDVRREFALHRRVSAHPNVVTVHRLVDEAANLFIVLDRHEHSGDLLTRIQKPRHLNRSAFTIEKAFLQLLDAVEHCHSLGVYHRNIRPDAIVCFDGGRLAITDFGLATAEKMSEEHFAWGGRYMAPECREDGGASAGASLGPYAPSSCDVWSLGAILLSLITGRAPGNISVAGVPALLAGLSTTSDAEHALLERTLQVDWTRRITVSEMRREFAQLSCFYAPVDLADYGDDMSEDARSSTHSRPASGDYSEYSPMKSSALRGPPPHGAHSADMDEASDIPAAMLHEHHLGKIKGFRKPVEPTEAVFGDGQLRLPKRSTANQVLSITLSESANTALERSALYASESASEMPWRPWDEHTRNMTASMLSLPQTVQHVRSHRTTLSTSSTSDLHTFSSAGEIYHTAELSESRTSLRLRLGFDRFIAPIRIAFLRRLYARRQSQTSLETFGTFERRRFSVDTTTDSECALNDPDAERWSDLRGLLRLRRALRLDADNAVVGRADRDGDSGWISVDTLRTTVW